MREGWKQYKIEDVAIVGDGAHASIKRQETGIMYLTSKNFDLNGLKLEKVDYISENDFIKYFNSNSKALTKPKYNDVVLSIIGSMGAPYVVKKNDDFGLSSSVSILRPNEEIILPNFLYYWIKSDYFQKSIDNIKSGVAQSFLSLGMIRSLPCITPPLQTQRKIASILSGYDDLIENNLKRIQLLEEKAQLTYEEWFVKMRFPGFETAVFDEVTGLPAGWEKKELQEIANVVTGKTPSTSNSKYFGNDIPFIKTPDLHTNIYIDNAEQYLSHLGANSQKNKFFPKNTILLACIGARAGAVGLTSCNSQCNQQINGLICKKEKFTFYVYFFCRALTPLIRALGSNGATMTNVSKGKLEKVDIIQPENILIDNFHKIVKNEFESILLLQNQNRLLKEARDILLPRLMNGMVDPDKISGQVVEELQTITLQTTE